MKKYIGKLLIVIVPIIAAIVLMLPSYRSYELEAKKSEAMKLAAQAPSRADSAAIMEKFEQDYGEDLKKAQETRLKLGLDLRGGMYVTLEVDVVKLIEETAQRESIDDIFNEVIEQTNKEAKESEEPALKIFLKYFDQIARPKGKSLLSYFETGDIREASEEKIIETLETNTTQAIDQALEVIRQRIDKYGLTEPNIQKQGTRRIVLELPGVTNEGEVRQLLSTTARLEFKLVRNNQDIVSAFFKIDKALKEQLKRRKMGLSAVEAQPLTGDSALAQSSATIAAETETTKESGSITSESGTQTKDTTNPYAGLSDEEAKKKFSEDHPFTRMFATYYVPQGKNQNVVPIYYINSDFPKGEYFFRIDKDSINKFNEIISRPELKNFIPYDLQVAISAKPDERLKKESKVEIFDIYALKKDAELTGDVIVDARASFDQTTNQPMVLMGMNTEGAERWAVITGANLQKRISIVLDDRVYSAPTVQSKITGGSSQITGMSNVEEARLLEIVLKAGALKAPVQIIEERVVGPSLGEDSIKSGLTASLIAVLLVILYMAMYYSVGGLIADFAVLLNVSLIIAVLSAFGGTLTLPGISGIILTIGMAVDANVLIFERIREELSKGRSIRSAVDEGYSKALSAVMDSNITTFITGLILFYFGSGPIQGFAMTLMIGILGTLFTAIIVTRAIIEIFIVRGATTFNFGQPKHVQI